MKHIPDHGPIYFYYGCFLWLIITLMVFPLGAAAATPNIILITLDTVRADHMGFLGSKRGLTPHLDTFSQSALIFTRAYSQVPLTTASHATILTGTFPELHGVDEFGKPLPPDIPYLPDVLKSHGYRTAAFVGSLVLDPAGGLAPGFDRGFEVYDAGFRKPLPGEDRFKTLERRGGEVIARAESWLQKSPRTPFFLWVHLYDGHDPYDPPAPYATRFANSPYDGEIAYVDECVGELLAALQKQNLYSNSIIAVAADHGESLGQHGEETHGIFLYDQTLHVPLLIKLPKDRFSSQRIESQVGLVDVAPTLLDLAGLSVPHAMQGESLSGLIMQSSAAHSIAARPVYAESDYSNRAFGWSSLHSLRVGNYLFIEAPRRELYDRSADPGQLNNLADTKRAVTDTLAAELNDFRRKLANGHTSEAPAGLTSEQVERLNSLGYMASDKAVSGAAARDQGADPKDKIAIANWMHDALMGIEEGRYADSIPPLDRILGQEPHLAAAQRQLGIAYSRTNHPDKAVPLLQQAVQGAPDDLGMAHYELGLALFASGDMAASVPNFQFAVERSPKMSDAHYSLASAYAQTDRIPEAITELQKALQLTPGHYAANLLLGRILSLQGSAKSALPYLEKAEEVQPSSVDAHAFLADAYQQMNEPENAQREREAAERIKTLSKPAGAERH